MMFSLFPAPGPLLGLGAGTEGVLSVSIFEPNKPLIDKVGGDAQADRGRLQGPGDGGEGAVHRLRDPGARRAGTPGRSSSPGSRAPARSTRRRSATPCTARARTPRSAGTSRSTRSVNNFWPTTSGIKQIQNGEWVMVWPQDRAAAPIKGPATCSVAAADDRGRCPCRYPAARATPDTPDHGRRYE